MKSVSRVLSSFRRLFFDGAHEQGREGGRVLRAGIALAANPAQYLDIICLPRPLSLKESIIRF